MSDPSQARFVRALVRSASTDGPAPGASARARARLGIADAATKPFGLAGAVLLGALLVATSIRSGPDVTVVSMTHASAECPVGIEAPPASCGDYPSSPAQATVSGSSSGTDLVRASSGG